ncbi:MAG: cache domain-containing protein, partial [Candidatus Hydrogenedentales bacterium]
MAVPAIALLLYTSIDRRALAEQAVTQQAERLASLKALDQQRLIEGTRQLLMAMSQSRDVREGDRDACSAYMRRIVPHFEAGYTNVGVIDAHGTVTCSGFTAVSGSLADREYFQRARATKQFVVGEYVISRHTGKPSLPFAFPVLDDEGDVQQVVFAAVDLDPLNRRLGSADWPAEATSIVTDRA